MYCLICGAKTMGCRCQACGFDLSRCRERYPTLEDLAGARRGHGGRRRRAQHEDNFLHAKIVSYSARDLWYNLMR